MERDFFPTPFDGMPPELLPPLEDMPPEFMPPFDAPTPAQLRQFFKRMREKAQNMHLQAFSEIDATINHDAEKFEMMVDVQHFAPEGIEVLVVDGDVVVKCKHEEKQDQLGYISRQFVRRHPLPEGCLSDTVEASLSSNFVLTVTAPKVLAMPSIGERIVPITRTGPVNQIGAPQAATAP